MPNYADAQGQAISNDYGRNNRGPQVVTKPNASITLSALQNDTQSLVGELAERLATLGDRLTPIRCPSNRAQTDSPQTISGTLGYGAGDFVSATNTKLRTLITLVDEFIAEISL